MNDVVRTVVAEILGTDKSEVSEALSAESADNWDSLNHLRIISALEQECRVTFVMDEIQSAMSVSALIRLIEQKTAIA